MIPQEDDLCPYCLKNGLRNQIQTYQINWRSAMILCPNPECIFPLDQQVSLIESDGKKRASGEPSIDSNLLKNTLKDLKTQNVETGAKMKQSEHLSDSSREMGDNQIPDDLSNDFIGDSCLEGLLAGDEEDFEGFDAFLDYLSNLPGSSYSKFTEIPLSMVPEYRRKQFEILRVIPPPALMLSPEHQRLQTVKRQSDGFSSMDALTLASMEPRRYAQWSATISQHFSWLVSGLSAVIHSSFIRYTLRKVSQGSPKVKDSSLISSIFEEFEQAMQKLYVALSLSNNKSIRVQSGDENEPSDSNMDYLHFGNPRVSISREMHVRITDHLTSCQNKVFQNLKKDNVTINHPADLISCLLHSHDSLRNTCVVSYRQNFQCTVCQYNSCEDIVSRSVTIESDPALSTFSLSDSNCYSLCLCSACGATDQRSQISWMMVSPLLFLHFPKGLPNNCKFERLKIASNGINLSKESIGGIDRFCVTSRGQFEMRVSTIITYGSENQYTTWVRRGADTWMACKESLGEDSHMAEWDPMKPSQLTEQGADTVRILLLEAFPVEQSMNQQTLSHQKGRKSLLEERILSIMQQRKNQTSGETSLLNPASMKAVPPMIQRFLDTDTEHESVANRTSRRFQPYPADPSVKSFNRKTSADSSKKKANRESEIHLGRYKSNKTSESVGKDVDKDQRSLTKRSSSISLKEEASNLNAIKLWPSKTKSAPSNLIIPKSAVSSSSGHSQEPSEVVTFNLDATTAFLEGQSSGLRNDSK